MKNLIAKRGLALLVAVAFLMTVFAVPVESFADASTKFNSRESASAYYLQQLKNHASVIEFDFDTTNSNGSEVSQWFKNDAFRDNASSMSLLGDYYRYGVYNGYSVSRSQYTTKDNVTHYHFTYKMSYKLSASQDRAFESKLTSVVNSLNLSGKSQYNKVKAIYDYITRTVKYDRTHGSTYYVKYTGYGALCNGTSVCQGYADLFYRMCKKVGVPVRIVTGTSRNQGHAWNIVSIDGKFYNVDATWDAGKSSSQYAYFLKSNAAFKDHVRNSEYTDSLFNSACPMSSSSKTVSTYSIAKAKPASVKAKKASRTSIKISWKKVSEASGYIVYRSTNNGKSYKKIATVSSKKTSYVNKKLKTRKTYKYKIKAYKKVGSKKTYSKLSSCATRKL